jgi:hypothetical protein
MSADYPTGLQPYITNEWSKLSRMRLEVNAINIDVTFKRHHPTWYHRIYGHVTPLEMEVGGYSFGKMMRILQSQRRHDLDELMGVEHVVERDGKLYYWKGYATNTPPLDVLTVAVDLGMQTHGDPTSVPLYFKFPSAIKTRWTLRISPNRDLIPQLNTNGLGACATPHEARAQHIANGRAMDFYQTFVRTLWGDSGA